MAYEKQVFTDGQVLNAAHLNNMEDGIAAAHDATAKNAESIEALNSANTAAEERLTALDQTDVELEEQINSNFITLWDGINGALSRIRKLEADVPAVAERVTDLEEAAPGLLERVGNVETAGSELQNRVKTLEDAPEELPAVTESDNDKFLRVVGGVWAAGTVSSAEEESF